MVTRAGKILAEARLEYDKKTGQMAYNRNTKPKLDIRKFKDQMKRTYGQLLSVSRIDDTELEKIIMDRVNGFRNINMYMSKNINGRGSKYTTAVTYIWRDLTNKYDVQ